MFLVTLLYVFFDILPSHTTLPVLALNFVPGRNGLGFQLRSNGVIVEKDFVQGETAARNEMETQDWGITLHLSPGQNCLEIAVFSEEEGLVGLQDNACFWLYFSPVSEEDICMYTRSVLASNHTSSGTA